MNIKKYISKFQTWSLLYRQEINWFAVGLISGIIIGIII